MKKCIKCECIYPDYHENCPCCGSNKSKEWKIVSQKDAYNNNTEVQTNETSIIDYSYEDLKDIIQTE